MKHASFTAFALFGACAACAVQLSAQTSPSSELRANPSITSSACDSTGGGQPRGFLKHMAVGAWVAQSVDARTASHNESISGSMTMFAVRIEREVPISLPVGLHVNYVGELLPLILVTSEAPPQRIPMPKTPGDPIPDADTYARRTSYGVGISPLGAEVIWSINNTFSTVANATVGGEWFNKVVPYGKATRANFTFTPGLELRWRAGSKSFMSLGYKLHHLSNASFGGSNPGINAHMVNISLMRTR